MRFGTTDLTSGQWLTALALAGVAFAVPELWKLAQRRLTAAEARSRVLSTDAVRATS